MVWESSSWPEARERVKPHEILAETIVKINPLGNGQSIQMWIAYCLNGRLDEKDEKDPTT